MNSRWLFYFLLFLFFTGRVRVEPKTFFANERTFIQWLSVGMLLMSVGIAIVEVISSS